MIAVCRATTRELSKCLYELRKESPDPMIQAREAIQLISQTLSELRTSIANNGFPSIADEIEFFKLIKPVVDAELIYNNVILDIETKRAIQTKQQSTDYLHELELDFLNILQMNFEFVKYFKSDQVHLDTMYFTRKAGQFPISGKKMYVYHDPEFTNEYSYLVASLMAYDKLVETYHPNTPITQSNLNWTDSKLSLVELIYALHDSGAINNGKASIKELCQVFESMFNVEVDDVYRAFHEISQRKNDRVRFVNGLEAKLTERLDNQDE
ncbi:MAG: RteC domain-containing protein [Crocinitomicaceae bacterium]|nr:RteC domain-containing protein [Crocinitomicaceae bacterium]